MKIYGLIVASFITIFIPIWIIGWKFIPLKLKIIFTIVGFIICWYSVEFGGTKRGIFTK